MTKPTLTDLRETAWMIVDCDIADNRIALARAFLSLTDPIMCYQRQLATVTAERDELRRELAEIREKIQDAAMEAREEQYST